VDASRSQTASGQRGDHLVLVNGADRPHMEMSAHHIERWRLVNAARAEYLRLSLDGQPLVMIASSGGLLPEPVSVQDLVLAPGERLDLAVGPFTEGRKLLLLALPYVGAVETDRHRLATLHVTRNPGSSATADAPVDVNRIHRHIDRLTSPAAQPTHTVRLPQRSPRRTTDVTHGTVPQVVRTGQLQVWDIVNDNAIDQPFYLPGFYFQTLARNGSPLPQLSWQDTATVPARGRIRIAWLPDDRPGRWTYCHHTLERYSDWIVGHFDIVS
jgi:FtsP/CotA-like multicopper oxidase with cupredoxin domain